MNRCVGLLTICLAAALAHAGEPKPQPPRLAAPVELMKLPKDQVPAITFADPFLRVSPKGDRCIYLKRDGSDYKFVLNLREFGPPAAEHPAPTAVPAVPVLWMSGFSGRCWRADGMQVAYLLAGKKDGMEGEDIRYRLGVACFDWTLPLPQQSGGGIAKGARTHTAVTFGCVGKDLWRAESDLRKYSACRIVGPKGVAYESKGVAIHHLAASPDGKHLAWVELPPRGRARQATAATAAAKEAAARAGVKGATFVAPAGPSLVVMEIATGKIPQRVSLAMFEHDRPVWADAGKTLCYGQVVLRNQLYRREVSALTLADGSTRRILYDAKAVGAVGGRLIANRGPSCETMAQGIRSEIPALAIDNRPRHNEIVACDLAAGTEPIPLLRNAFAQQIVGADLIYAEENGPDVIVWRATLRVGEDSSR